MLLIAVFVLFLPSNGQEWFAVHVAHNLEGDVSRPGSIGSYDLKANKTFITFLGEDWHIYAQECDHNNNDTWSDPVKIADSPTTTSAKYAYPQMVQTPDGYLHVFFVKHTTNMWYARSTNPSDISSWEVRDISYEAAEGSPDFQKLRPSYPCVLVGRNGFIYLFWRQSTEEDYTRPEAYCYSRNSGETWEGARMFITPVRPDYLNEAYTGMIVAEPRRESVPERFHVVYFLAGGPEGHNQYHKNLYNAIFQPGDGHFISLKGDDLGPTLDADEMDNQYCLIFETETAKDAVGYNHSVGITDTGIPIVDGTYYWDGDAWVTNDGNGLFVDSGPAFLRWEDGRMLAYCDRVSIYETNDMGNNWELIGSADGSTGSAGTPDITVPITNPSHPSAKVWLKEGKIGSSTNVLTIAGVNSSRTPKKIILTANYPGLPLNGQCTIRAFVCDEANARIMDSDATISFEMQGNGTLGATQAQAVNGMAEISYQASGMEGVDIVRATGSGLTGDYLEIYIGTGILQNVMVSEITVTGEDGSTEINTLEGTLQLSSQVMPDNASIKAVDWSIQDGTGQAGINSSGLVTAIADGTVTATASATDGSGVEGHLELTISNQNVPTGLDPAGQELPEIATGKLEMTIRFPGKSNIRDIAVFNQLGIQVRNIQTRVNTCTLDVSSLSSGMYIVVIREEGKSSVVKVVKP